MLWCSAISAGPILPALPKNCAVCISTRNNEDAQNHWSESGRATAVGSADALGRPLRSVLSLGITMTDSQIDDAVLSSIEPRWQKVAMVISRAAKKLYGDLPEGEDAYEMIARRIEFLVESGRLQSQGDISRWRFSEVRQA
jgi:hypothetical protein